MDPKSPLMQYSPSHWKAEIRATLTRLQSEYKQDNNRINITRCALYQNLPAIHGLLINRRHLFLGYAGWAITPSGPVMAGAQMHHKYYSLNQYSQSYFELFNDWLQLAPSREVDLSDDISRQF